LGSSGSLGSSFGGWGFSSGTSLTEIVIDSLSSSEPDFAITSKVYVPLWEFVGVQVKEPELEDIEAPLGALLAKLNLILFKELSVTPTMNDNLLPSSTENLPCGLISRTCSGVSDGVAELSFDELPTPTPLMAETL